MPPLAPTEQKTRQEFCVKMYDRPLIVQLFEATRTLVASRQQVANMKLQGKLRANTALSCYGFVELLPCCPEMTCAKLLECISPEFGQVTT